MNSQSIVRAAPWRLREMINATVSSTMILVRTLFGKSQVTIGVVEGFLEGNAENLTEPRESDGHLNDGFVCQYSWGFLSPAVILYVV